MSVNSFLKKFVQDQLSFPNYQLYQIDSRNFRNLEYHVLSIPGGCGMNVGIIADTLKVILNCDLGVVNALAWSLFLPPNRSYPEKVVPKGITALEINDLIILRIELRRRLPKTIKLDFHLYKVNAGVVTDLF